MASTQNSHKSVKLFDISEDKIKRSCT